MNRLNESLLQGYLTATQPWRAWTRWRLAQESRLPLCVLFYHRVADASPNGWSMTCEQFTKHLDWMQSHVDLISLDQMQRRMVDGNNGRVAATITFDDGYAENCDFAIPELTRRNIPCTYFVSLDFVQTGRRFPHDQAAGFDFAPNTIRQLRDMAEMGIEIGAHTRHHPDMGKVTDPARIFDEVVRATQELSDLLGQPVRRFAFPFGLPENLNAHAAALAQEHGMIGVCSAYGAYNLPGEDPFHIQRIHGDPELVRLKNWLTIDPRKLKIGRDFTMPEPSMPAEFTDSELVVNHAE